MTLPDIAIFSRVIADPRFWLAVAISILSGAVRGFSGFGSALIYVPLMSAVYEPRIAAASFLLIDFATGLAFAFGVWRRASWAEITPLAAAAIVAAQFGVMILQYAQPDHLRWAIALGVLALVPILASGWRYHGRPWLPITLAVGLLAGLFGGAVQISGPPIILYWLGSASEAAVVRANFIVYFAIFSAASVVIYVYHGLLTPEVLALALLIGPLHIFAMWAGGRLFHLASERVYRVSAYVIITFSALVSMPIWDKLVR